MTLLNKEDLEKIAARKEGATEWLSQNDSFDDYCERFDSPKDAWYELADAHEIILELIEIIEKK